MLISSVQDKKGDEQEGGIMGHSEGLLRCVMSENQFELNLDEIHFGDDGDRTRDSDLDLYFKPRESQVDEKPQSWPRRHVENIVHDYDTEAELSDDEICDGIQHISKLNNKIYTILNSARGTGNLYNKIGFTLPSELERKYEHTLKGQAAYTKDLLHSLNNISGDSITSCLPKSLLDYISTQSDDLDTGVYMESVISHVYRTIEQLRKISNGDYLTERAKEKWREVYDYPLPYRAALTHFDQSLIARSCDPLPFNTEPITWNAIVHSDINSRNFSRIFEKKIVIEIPKAISDNFFNRHFREVFVNCKMNSLIPSERKDKKDNEEANVIVELQSPVTQDIVDNSFDHVIFFESEPPPLPALENHTIAPQVERLHNSPVNNEPAIDTALPTQELEAAQEPIPHTSCDEIKFLNEDYDNFALVPSSDDSQTHRIPEECHASTLSADVIFRADKSPSINPVFLGNCSTTVIVSTINLTNTMQRINNCFPVIEENTEESPPNKKVKSPQKARVKSPYENMKFVIEEKRRKKLLEIRQKEKLKKRVVAETKESKSKVKTKPAPQTTSSVTKLSITNKSFYNSIFGHKIRLAIDTQKAKNNDTKKENGLAIPNNSDEDAVEENARESSVLSTNECRIANRNCCMNDSGIDVALLPNHAEDFISSVDDVIKELLQGTDEVPVKLDKSLAPQSSSPPITNRARKVTRTRTDSPRSRTPVNMKNRHNHARRKVSVLECRQSIEKVYEFLHNVSGNEPEDVSKRPSKTVSFGKPNQKKVEDQKPKPKSLQQLSKPINIRNPSPPPFPIISPMRIDTPRSSARTKETTPRKPKPPSVLETVINQPVLYPEKKKKKVVKKMFSDDDDREARGEAVRGPSITARLNALAQPRKPYVKAFNEELQQKAANFRTMNVNQQKQIRGGIDAVSSMSFRRPPAAVPGTIGAERRSRLIPGVSPRPTSPMDKGSPPRAPQSPRPSEIGEPEPSPNIGKKAVSFKEDLKFQRVSANTSQLIVQEMPPPSASPEPKPNMMLRLPTSQDYELLSTSSSTESFTNENKTSPGTSSTKVVLSNDSDLRTTFKPESTDTFHIMSQESLMLKEIFSETAAFTLDIFRDKTVSTAVEAVENDAVNNQHNDSPSTCELDKLEDALQKQISGSPLRKRLIKNFTLTPKHSMQQVLLLHSGDTGSCIAPLQTPAPSCIKITTSKSDTVAELGVFPLVSNYDLNWNNFIFPMQIATVGYAFPQQFDATKNTPKRNVKPLNINGGRNPSISIRPTSKVTRDVKKKNPKIPFKGKKKTESLIKSAAIDNTINAFHNLKFAMIDTLSKTKLNKKHLQKCETKSAETITIIQADTRTKPNDDTSSSLDILVNLLNEMQKITTSQTKIASVANLCPQEPSTDNETDLENSCFLLGSFDTKAKEMQSITTLEQMRQLDSTASLYSYMLSSEADINQRIKLTTPLYINKEIGVNFPDKQLVSKYADVNFQTITVNNATNVSESFLKLIEIHRPVLYLSENVTQYSETLILDRVVDRSNIQHFNLDCNVERSNKDVLPIADVILDEFEEEIFQKMVEEVIEEEEPVKEIIAVPSIDKNNTKPKKDHSDALLKRIDEILASKSTKDLKTVKAIATKSLVSKPEENKLETKDIIETNTELFYDDCLNTETVLKPAETVEDSKIDETDVVDPEDDMIENEKMDRLDTMKEGVAESNSLMKIKRDILVTVYSVLAVTVFAALSLPEVLYFSDLNV